jgi:FkbM family methyltransferase
MVENSVLIDVKHAGVSMKLRMSKDDDATTRLTEEGNFMAYDLGHMDDASLLQNSSKEDDKDSSKGNLLNMIDIGGNYGVVTIAVMKTYAKKLRVVTLEPAPATFFFLRWNLHINGVPEIDAADWDPKKGTSGVLAMNAGSADKDGQSLHFCYYADSSMNSKMCDCKEGDNGCLILPSITIDDLGAKFDTQPIAMMKMDCEGCEFESLPALVNSKVAKRVQRFMGELHIPDEKIEELACRWDHGRLVKKCQFSKTNPQDVECDVELDCPK